MDLRRLPTFLIPRACVAIALNLIACSGTLNAQPLGNIVAVVNGQVISSVDLQRRERFLLAQLVRSQQAAPNKDELSAAVLERAIFETLMLQSAAKQGLVPNDAAVQQAIADNAFQSGLSVRQFVERVEASGTPIAEYATDLKNEMAMASVRERTLSAKSKISDTEVDRFLREEQSGISQEFAVQTLFLPKLESDSTAQTSVRRSQATALLGNAKAAQTPEAFAGLQNTVVDAIGKHVVNTPFRTLDKFPEIFSAAIENMAVGAVSPLLESSAGFYVLRLANKRTLLPQVTQTKARHILLRVEGNSPEAEEAARQTIKKLHDRLTLNIELFPAIAKEFSQDGSAAKGGDLAWALPGDMVPEFERVMDVLKEGEMALPLRSQFGWHIVQVLERKAGDLPKERLRAQARNVLRTRKQDEALGEWLEQLKAQAYIEYKR